MRVYLQPLIFMSLRDLHVRPPSIRSLLVAVVTVSPIVGCAQQAPKPAPDPAQLETERTKRPNDPTLLRELGGAYMSKSDFARARDVLRLSVAADPRNAEGRILLAASYEELGQLDSATVAYRAAQPLASKEQQKLIAGKQAALARKHLVADARAALERERSLTLAAPTTGTVAVMPFRYTGMNPDLQPLERGLAELLVADLGKVQRLKLLERERMQALVDEMKLTEQGRADAATGARSGRLLGAGQIVQGVLSDRGQDLAFDANVVDATDASVDASASGAGSLNRIIDTEKQVLFGLLRGMNVPLSPAEERALSERPTADLQAFLAYSRGLLREDAGDFAGAADAYGEAARRDPGFRAAQTRQGAARQAVSAAVPAAALTETLAAAQSGGGAVDQLRDVIEGVVPSRVPTILGRTGLFPIGGRPQVPEAARTDDPRTAALLGQVIIIIPRP